MSAWCGRDRQDHPLLSLPVVLRTAGVLALGGAAVMAIAAAGRPDLEVPPQAALVAEHGLGAQTAVSKASARLIPAAEPAQAAGDLPPVSAEPGLSQPAAGSAGGAGPAPDVASAAPSALLAAAAKRASELTGADDRTSPPAGTVQADEPAPAAKAARFGQASAPADVIFARAYAPAEIPSGEAAGIPPSAPAEIPSGEEAEMPSGEPVEMTALQAAPPVPQARPEAPPAPREAARTRKSTRVARAAWPADPPPKCGRKRARWRYVKDVPTWFCR